MGFEGLFYSNSCGDTCMILHFIQVKLGTVVEVVAAWRKEHFYSYKRLNDMGQEGWIRIGGKDACYCLGRWFG